MGPLCTMCWCRSIWESIDHYKFKIILDCPTEPPPREQDALLISLFGQWTNKTHTRRNLNICRIAWNAIFLSDVETANGRQVEQHMTQPPTALSQHRSAFDFQEQWLTPADWVVWNNFWDQTTIQGYTLHKPLGAWLHTTHRYWEWYCDDSESLVERKTDDTIETYLPEPTNSSRRTPRFTKTSSRIGNISTQLVPCSISHHEDTSIRLHRPGPNLYNPTPTLEDFWDFLGNRGGTWMWANSINDSPDLTWVASALSNGSSICVTDSSYKRDIAPDVSGASWVIYCT